MTPKHPLSWFMERVGKTVVVSSSTGSSETTIKNESHAENLHGLDQQILEWEFRDPHPLTASILTCNVISCDTCGKIGTTEDLDKEVAANGFEGEGWNRLSDGTVGCGCKK